MLDVSPSPDAPAPPAQRLAVVLNGEVLREIVLTSRRLVALPCADELSRRPTNSMSHFCTQVQAAWHPLLIARGA